MRLHRSALTHVGPEREGRTVREKSMGPKAIRRGHPRHPTHPWKIMQLAEYTVFTRARVTRKRAYT